MADGVRVRDCGHDSRRGMAGEHASFVGHGIRGFGFANQQYNDYRRGHGRRGSCGMYEDFKMLDRVLFSHKSLAFVEVPGENLLC